LNSGVGYPTVERLERLGKHWKEGGAEYWDSGDECWDSWQRKDAGRDQCLVAQQ